MSLDIVKLGLVVGEVLNKVLNQLPTHDQRKINEFFKFMDRYNEEIRRKDADFDDILAWKQRKSLLLDTIIAEISRTRKK